MPDIRKVTPDESPRACLPTFCVPNASLCNPSEVALCTPSQQVLCTPSRVACVPSVSVCLPLVTPLQRNVSGTYRSPAPSGSGTILELRVDVDGRRPQSRVSGDYFSHFHFWIFPFTIYTSSFVVESLTATEVAGEMVIMGPVIYYSDPTRINDTIEVRIPRVSIFSSPADATVKFYSSGTLTATYLCPKISEFFRTVTLEIDRFQGATFPPTANTHVDPHPADLPNEDLTVAQIFSRAGVDMTVTEDDVLNDPDSPDPGTNWDEAELHDLMENRFDLYANSLRWNTYGVVVPRFGDPNYNPGYYGVMFDWGPWQAGDTYHRQGAAVAYDAIQGRVSGTLYNTAAKKARFFLETFAHEIGHSFNLPHTWSRSTNPDSGSESFMNYPWGYTGGAGGESAFWSNFRWEFDDVELIWMRHADRNDVIFGGRDWIGNNLSIYTEPEIETRGAPLKLEVRAWDVFDFGQPVRVELKLKNISESNQKLLLCLEPEDGLVTLYIRRPNGDVVRYIPPLYRFQAHNEVEVAPGESIYESALLSFGAKGPQFQEPGEYIIRAYYNLPNGGLIVSRSCRLRVCVPSGRNSEELAHLLFSREAAKFLYFGGTERYPEVTSRLKEAVEKYAKTDPVVVRHINAALGLHQARRFKQVISKENRQLVTFREANLQEAAVHLEAARELLPVRKVSALDHITYNKLSVMLAECYLKQDNRAQAERTLRESLRYFERRGIVKSVLNDYRARIKTLSERGR